jgi:glutathione S-transferase
MLIVHHLNNSRAQRVLWLLEELGVPYEIKHYQRDPKTMLAPDSLKAIHPLGKSPVVTDGENTVAESAAILEYILDRYGAGQLRPAPGTPEYLRYRFFLHYAEGSFMPLMLLSLAFGRMRTQPAPFFAKPIVKGISETAQRTFIGPQTKLHLAYLNGELKGRQWLLGDTLSAADIQLSFPIEAASVRSDLRAYPELSRYLAQIRRQPSYLRAIEKGGPFALG